MENIVFFDGVCGLCNRFVDVVIRMDKKKKIFFAPLQGNVAKQNLDFLNEEFDTVIFLSNNKIYTKSTAAIRIAASMGGVKKIALVFLVIPAFIRDYIYDWISKNRYKWFGKNAVCRVPSEEEKERFLI